MARRRSRHFTAVAALGPQEVELEHPKVVVSWLLYFHVLFRIPPYASGINFPKSTLHVCDSENYKDVCDPENYTDNLSWNYIPEKSHVRDTKESYRNYLSKDFRLECTVGTKIMTYSNIFLNLCNVIDYVYIMKFSRELIYVM